MTCHGIKATSNRLRMFVAVALLLLRVCHASSNARHLYHNTFFPVVTYQDGTLGRPPKIYDHQQECLYPNTELSFPQTVRIGVSAPISSPHHKSALDHRELVGMLNGFIEWHDYSKSSYWSAGSVRICVLDDEGRPELMESAYSAFAGNTTAAAFWINRIAPWHIASSVPLSVMSMDFLLGPAEYSFSEAAAQIANRFQKLILLWSSPRVYYNLPYLPSSYTGMQSSNVTVNGTVQSISVQACLTDTVETFVGSATHHHTSGSCAILGQTNNPSVICPGNLLWKLTFLNGFIGDYKYNDLQPCTNITLLVASGNLASPTVASSQARRLQLVHMPVPIPGSAHVLNLNSPVEQYVFPILQKIFDRAKATKAVPTLWIFDFGEATFPLAAVETFAAQLGFNVSTHRLATSLHGNSFMYFVRGQAGSTDVDALVYGSAKPENYLMLFVVIPALNIVPGAVVCPFPGTYAALKNVLKPDLLLGFLEPRPLGFLSYGLGDLRWSSGAQNVIDFSTLTTTYHSHFGTWPTMMTIQVLAAGAVLSNAMFSRSFNSLTQTKTSYITDWARIWPTPTLDGSKLFDQLGVCIGCSAGIHQAHPLLPDGSHYPVENILRIIPPVNYSVASYPWPSNVSDFNSAAQLSWLDKKMVFYACGGGCIQVGVYCVECPTGKYRSRSDLYCRDCASGTYADETALTACKECPTGASCNSTVKTPIAIAGHFLLNNPLPRDVLDASQDSCAFGRTHHERFHFVPCIGSQSCAGNNECKFTNNFGLVCASCRSGSTYMGFFPNRRTCLKCPSLAVLMLRMLLIMLIFFVVFMILCYVTKKHAESASSTAVPILCIAIRHLQLLGIIQSSMALDRWYESFFSTFPGIAASIITQPALVMQLDCLIKTSPSLEAKLETLMRSQRNMSVSSSDDTVEIQNDQYAPIKATYWFTFSMMLVGIVIIAAYRMGLRILRYWQIRWSVPRAIRAPKVERMSRKAKRREMMREFHVELYGLPRQLIAWSYLTAPPVALSASFTLSCHSLHGFSDSTTFLLANPHIVCDLKAYTDWFPRAIASAALLILPTILGFWHAVWKRDPNLLPTRFTAGFLVGGWCPQCSFFEVLLFVVTLAMACVPAFVRGKDLVFIVQLAILTFSQILRRRLRPRAGSERRILESLEGFSRSTLQCTLLIGYVINVANIPNPLISESVTPTIIKRNKITVLDILALVHVFFLVRCCCAFMWNQVIVPMQIFYSVYGEFSGLRYCILWISNKFCGLNAVKILGDEERMGDRCVDVSELKEHENHFLVYIMNGIVSVCMDSKERFNIHFIVAVFQEIFLRAGLTRAAVLNKHSGTERNLQLLRQCDVDSRLDHVRTKDMQGSGKTHRWSFHHASGLQTPDNICGAQTVPSSRFQVGANHFKSRARDVAFDISVHGITMDELYYAFMDVEVDVLNHEPSLLKSLKKTSGEQAKRPLSRKQFTADLEEEVNAADAEERESYGHEALKLQDVAVTNEFLRDVDRMVQNDRDMEARQTDIKAQLRHAHAEITRLHDTLQKHRLTRARADHARQMARQKGARSSQSRSSREPTMRLQSDMRRILGSHEPTIKTDMATLSAAWNNIAEEPADATSNATSVLSPRARGVELEKLPKSFWEHKLTKAFTSSKLLDEYESAAQLDAAPSTDEAAPTWPEELVADTPLQVLHDIQSDAMQVLHDIQSDAMETSNGINLTFEGTLDTVHHGVFKAMLLSSLRACGLSEDELNGMTISLHKGSSTMPGTMIARLCGDTAEGMREWPQVYMHRLKVMGRPLLDISESHMTRRKDYNSPRHSAQSAHRVTVVNLQKDLTEYLVQARFPHVQKRLETIRDPETVLTVGQIEQVKRINNLFCSMVGNFQLEADFCQVAVEEFNSSFGVKVADDLFRGFMSANFEGGDPIHAMSALTALDRSHTFNKDIIWVQLLSEDDPADTLWHVRSSDEGLGTKEDNVVQVNIIDALAEEGAFFVFISTPSDSNLSKLRGTSLPRPAPGAVRTAGALAGFRVQPLRMPGTCELWGFNLTSQAYKKPLRTTYNFLRSLAPADLLKLYCNMAQEFPRSFQDHLVHRMDLYHDSIERTTLFTTLRHRLQDTLPTLGMYDPPSRISSKQSNGGKNVMYL